MIGILVLAGWHTGEMSLVRLHPGFVPMQYVPALCLALLGTGLLAYTAGRRRVVIVLCTT